MSLENFLQKKPLYYDVIDYTRMPRIYAKLQEQLTLPKIIHVIGTNGKGTTGRFLAGALYSLGFKTGHYTSPHILAFNERIWMDGENVCNSVLNDAHKRLLNLLTHEDADALSYFEYTTLLAMYVYQNCDYVVLEAGLGGEHDATAVFDTIVTLVTPIDLDHESFLGTTLEEITKTKLNAVKHIAIIGAQKHKQVIETATELLATKSLGLLHYSELLTQEDQTKSAEIADALTLAPYLIENLQLAFAALHFLGLSYEAKDFLHAKLFGRLSQIRENILLDVGHNPLAAASIVKSLQGKKYTLVYNSYKDKNYKEILTILKPVVESVAIIKVDEQRIVSQALLEATIASLGLPYHTFKALDDEKNYLIFGSFSVAETFLRNYYNG